MISKNKIDFIDFIKKNQNYREDLITRMVFHSNRIEGSALTIGETDSILWDQNAKVKTSAREFYAVVNHQKAFDYLLQTIDTDLTNEIIINLGKIFNANVSEIEGFRKTGVIIRGSDVIPPNAAQVPNLMSQAIWQYNASTNDNSTKAYERESRFHITYEHIHPFADGNGRSGRALLVRGLLRSNFAPCVINSDNRSEYINCVSRKDANGLQKLIEDASQIEEKRIKSLL